MEYTKFADRRAPYRRALNEIREMDFSFEDLVRHYPAFAGRMNLARFLAFYESYKQTLGLPGDIAEIGVWQASCSLLFAKLTEIFEPGSGTRVHGFDWYRGTRPGPDEMTDRVREILRESATSAEENRPRTDEEAEEMYNRVRQLISAQALDEVVHIHKIDVSRELDAFFAEAPDLEFKIVFLDAGSYEVTRECLPHFWSRLAPGGVLILDQFNHEISPGETRAVREFLPDIPIYSYVFTGHPSAFIVKPGVATEDLDVA